MEVMKLSTRSRRRKRNSSNPKLAAYYYAAVVIFCSHPGHRTVIGLPGAESYQYEERPSFSSYSHGSVFRVRGGGESDEIDLQTSSHLSLLEVNTLTPVVLDRTRCYLDTGKRPPSPSKGLWNRINLIRGGVEDDKNEDEGLEVKGNNEESNSTTTNLRSEANANETPGATYTGGDTPTPTIATLDGTNSTSNLHGVDKHDDKPKQENPVKEGGVLSSFFSLFRAPEESERHDETPKNTSKIAHKIPHGPNGRGGGTSVYATLPPPSKEEESQNEQGGEGEFIITAEVAGVSTDTTAVGNVKLAKSLSSTSSKPETKPAVRTGRESTAFVVPPAHRPSSTSSVHSSKGKDAKKSKSSKTKLVAEEAVEIKATNTSLKSSLNATVATNTSGVTLNDNTTESLPVSNASVVKEASNSTKMGQSKDYTSSGYWTGIDLIASLGLSTFSEDLKISRVLRPVRKAAAKATGLHGFVSGKEYTTNDQLLQDESAVGGGKSRVISIDEELGIHDSNALEAEILARRVVSLKRRRKQEAKARAKDLPLGSRWGLRKKPQVQQLNGNSISDYVVFPSLDTSPDALEYRRRKRVEDIDRLLQRGSERLLELQCERDDLLCAPNPLFNYTKKYDPSTNQTFGDVRTTREFSFPSPELVDEYIGELVTNGRLIRLNHTELWLSRSDNGIDDDEDEIVGDDLLTPGAGASKLYENLDELDGGMNRKGNKNKSGGGSWLLRTGFGRNGGSLGEKLGETIEIAAYKGVCSSVMMVFAQMLSNLHGVNLLSHSDIRTYIEQDPDLPPVDKKYGPLLSGDKNNYAQDAIKTAIQKGAKKKRKSTKHGSSHRSSRHHDLELNDDAFIQRDFVVETLISHCQISAPLLKLFPLDWQRAMVGNIVTLATAIVSDFADGLQVQMLGHALTVSFKPITEADMIQHIGAGGFRQNHRRTRPDEFEAAVLATAQDMAENLSFLDGWLEWVERKVGGGVLRSQIGNLIARVVLTLVDEVLSGARLDLWSSQANGPRLYAALEYRTSKEEPLVE